MYVHIYTNECTRIRPYTLYYYRRYYYTITHTHTDVSGDTFRKFFPGRRDMDPGSYHARLAQALCSFIYFNDSLCRRNQA